MYGSANEVNLNVLYIIQRETNRNKKVAKFFNFDTIGNRNKRLSASCLVLINEFLLYKELMNDLNSSRAFLRIFSAPRATLSRARTPAHPCAHPCQGVLWQIGNTHFFFKHGVWRDIKCEKYHQMI